jgi:hypothetical protein
VPNTYDEGLKQILSPTFFNYFGEFRIKRFPDTATLEKYISNNEYGYSGAYPGICLGFRVIEHSKTSYELELMH